MTYKRNAKGQFARINTHLVYQAARLGRMPTQEETHESQDAKHAQLTRRQNDDQAQPQSGQVKRRQSQ